MTLASSCGFSRLLDWQHKKPSFPLVGKDGFLIQANG
jgi:hypothetical protein